MSSIRHLSLDRGHRRLYADIPLISDRGTAASGWRAVISLQHAGHMGRDTEERRAHRRALLSALDLEPDRVYGLTQVHSRHVVTVREEGPEHYGGIRGDGLLTVRREVVLSVTTADCLPIILFHPASGLRALLHSGWQGTGIVSRAWKIMVEEYGIPAAEIRTVIGPGIGPCCYAVPEARYRDFTTAYGEEAGRARAGRFYLDLRAANLALLSAAGAVDIIVIDDCTCCRTWLGSYRRDGKERFHNMLTLFGAWQPTAP